MAILIVFPQTAPSVGTCSPRLLSATGILYVVVWNEADPAGEKHGGFGPYSYSDAQVSMYVDDIVYVKVQSVEYL